MLFILRLLLIILLNKTYAYNTQDIEKILLPAWNSTSAEEILLTLKTFGKQIQLNLRRNQSSKFKENMNLWKHDAKGIAKERLLSQSNALNSCYYFHKDHITTAIINCCQEHGWEGLVFLKDETLEIRPLHDFVSMLSIDDLCLKKEINISFGKPHLIKRSLELSADTSFHNLDNSKLKQHHARNTQGKLTLELAIFFDEAAYRKFILFLDKSEEKLRLMILAYVNNIQALFHDPSLGVPVDISLVYLEIMREQPLDLPHFNGDANNLLDAFCSYAKARNPVDDNDPHHWDVGLYLTALDIFQPVKRKYKVGWFYAGSYAVGKSRPNGICDLNNSCAIVEFGTSALNYDMTSGFTSSLIAAREIGQLLGFRNEFSNFTYEDCDKGKYIMSYYQGYYGQLTWSECSRFLARRLSINKQCLRDPTKNFEVANDHMQYQNLPGREWTAKAQCEIFFRNKSANAVTLIDICNSLKCETTLSFKRNKTILYQHYTGPALAGTRCGLGKECRSGECVPVLQPSLEYCNPDNWSEWKEGPCESSCLQNSRGVKVKRRSCKREIRRTTNCDGLYYDMSLCDDSVLCTSNENRTTIDNYTFVKCSVFNNLLKGEPFKIKFRLEPAPGYQLSHSFEEPWRACNINCYRRISPVRWYPLVYGSSSVRTELLSMGKDPYFPDGTWCHKYKGQNYYCFEHECRPEKKS